MLLGCLYLFIIGSGRWSIDRLLDRDAGARGETDGFSCRPSRNGF
jgi:hypothetical protein